MKTHDWRETNSDGTMFYRANHHGKDWQFYSRHEDDEDWSEHDPIKREDWVMLRDVLWRKYQRNRCPWKLIARIDQILEDDE